MSGHVASHTSIFPNLHGKIVHSSGRFPSDLYNPDGSSREGTLADVNALWMMLFTSAWRGCRPSLNRQLRPWVAKPSTMAPQLPHSFASSNYRISWNKHHTSNSSRPRINAVFNSHSASAMRMRIYACACDMHAYHHMTPNWTHIIHIYIIIYMHRSQTNKRCPRIGTAG